MIVMSFFIKTFGCASNIADSEYVKNELKLAGLKETNEIDAEFIIVNTCVVKGPTINKIKNYIFNLKNPKYNIIIMGCMPSDKKTIIEFKKYSILTPYNLDEILSLIFYIKANKKSKHILSPKKLDKTQFSFENKDYAIIQPLIGCLGNCNYCRTKLAKPLFYSYPLENILNRIDYYIKKGVKEIWISSEDNAAYGLDIGLNYMILLNAIENKFAGKAMFRFGMANPWLLKTYAKELVNFIKNSKAFYKFLHIPIQSASTNVLKAMNRPYTNKDLHAFFKILRKLNYKELTLSTDIILGYYNETEYDFKKTLKFINKYDFLIVNISQLWVLPNTEVATHKQLPTEIKKERSRISTMNVENKSKKLLTSFLGKKVEVYFNKIDSDNNYLGRTRNYISVISKSKQELNVWKEVKINSVENFHLLC